MEISYVISGGVNQSRKTVVSFSQDDIYVTQRDSSAAGHP